MPIKFYQGTAEELVDNISVLENGDLAVATDEMQWYLKYNNTLKPLGKPTGLPPEQIQDIVQNGKATKYFSIGDQIITNWNDGTKEYVFPWDVVSFEDALQEDGTTKPAMWLQAHYSLPFQIQFDNSEAFYVAKDAALPAGLYNITLPAGYNEEYGGNKTYEFQLANSVPQGGCLKLLWSRYSTPGPIKTYASLSSTTAIEQASLFERSRGTSLGTIDGVNLNNIEAVRFGYNNYEKSAIRQYLNSNAGPNSWWTPQHPYDYICEDADKQGFLAGLDPEFVEILGEPVIKTAKNYITDGGSSTVPVYSETADKIFLPSLSQFYFDSELDEGTAWDYWKELSERNSPVSTDAIIPTFRVFAINGKTNYISNIWLRSARQNSVSSEWFLRESGKAADHVDAYFSQRCTPACCIC